MNIEYVTPDELWSNYPDLPIELQIFLIENQYRKQLKLLHGYIPEEKNKGI